MTTDSNSTVPSEPKPPRFGMGSFVFAIVLALIFFLLAQTMVRHRFHQGGWRDRSEVIRP
jgi:hypothetical protein